jgi:hypothetical protein
MSLQQKLKHEIKALGLAMLYFGCWIAGLLLLKQLVLAEYQIAFHDWSLALIGALILSKVVLILEHVSLGAWIRTRPAWVGCDEFSWSLCRKRRERKPKSALEETPCVHVTECASNREKNR